ncbi:MAG: hypothetical protein AAGF23_24060 [Acidobacteriota bacterium]
MKILWDLQARHKGFFAPSIGQIDVVSSHLADEAVGRNIDNLTIVTDAKGEFCDLELYLTPNNRSTVPQEAFSVRSPDSFLQTNLKSRKVNRWFFDQESGYLSIGLTDSPPDNWIGSEGQGLAIGTNPRSELTGIVFWGIEEDLYSRLQADWLKSLEDSRS